MKYIILICDGAADWPIEELRNKTIFEVSNTPNMDFIARKGKMGLLRTVPKGMAPGSECANMTIMGYRPERVLNGRGPLEALSAKVPLAENDLAFRCNLITIKEGIIKDYSAGHITTKESRKLINSLQKMFGGNGVDFFSGVQYRHILRLDGNQFSEKIITTPPHDKLDEPYESHLIKPINSDNEQAQRSSTFLNNLINKSNDLLINHKINKKRLKAGKRPATHIWPWSGGRKPNIRSFKEKYGLKGSVISAVDLLFGLGIAAGLDPIHVKGATGLPDTNYEGKVNAALKELKTKSFVYLHVEAIDEMGHTGDPYKKIKALEDFDRRIVGPILNSEKDFKNRLVIALLPDHPTPIEIRTHSSEPVPFAIYNPKTSNQEDKSRIFSEKWGKSGEYGLIENGEDFMEIFLKS
ncbi:MAG: cofactor-independent phosphoglycerate mutase [Candidatus Lokiarchaeota archaeon]|nr:cofactor-independent phosphoglycerate mutase [Candidatus Lokiarchaeota archaeon]MBD3337692.1 cofactor-independent phosphoglycerate mutase [Candidatus Lokiarchaeota archaeon]